ncbi:MAG: NAD-dependent epimerase/dehydratase family protein [Planctomycetes bacterium]|nr:NAD-dependent epimerase/dehydratase family protein [Planctomycetota bacterium]
MLNTDWRGLHGKHFEGARALVTGGAGFIGSHLAEALIKLGASVTVIDDLCGGDEANFNDYRAAAGDRLRFVKASILDAEAVARCTEGCRYVFHQAALGSVPRSVEQPVLYAQVNIIGTQTVLEAARKAGVKRVMFAASSSAYGDSPTLPKIETMPPLPKSPYAAGKLAGEALMRCYAASYGLDTASLRYFNIFGYRQNANSAYAAVIAAFAKALVAGKPPVIFGDGEQSRDFTFVHNAVHANLLAARAEREIGGEVINIACGERVTVNELAAQMASMFGRPDLKAEHREDRAGDVKHSLADLSQAKKLLGYAPIVPFSAGLAPTVAWYREVLKA